MADERSAVRRAAPAVHVLIEAETWSAVVVVLSAAKDLAVMVSTSSALMIAGVDILCTTHRKVLRYAQDDREQPFPSNDESR
ncbi:hypothetical protein [Reyranella sp. CPCC 100927]|uniref:hypothetical protein n=1 Tax=Reyranella sp. CPCC 100927 TaxID=2599616 RepID=UPI0011B6A0AC|nr:hypothetical protein [Reyranella sp. CPCC 100927]TWT06128.1 hypothetical protein FQU96_24090 [Reyranella sp. CPCC 100927]